MLNLISLLSHLTPVVPNWTLFNGQICKLLISSFNKILPSMLGSNLYITFQIIVLTKSGHWRGQMNGWVTAQVCNFRRIIYFRGGFLNYATYATQGSCVKFYATHVTYATQRKTLRKNYASNATHATQLES